MLEQNSQVGTLSSAIDHFVKITESFDSGLIHCYDVADPSAINRSLPPPTVCAEQAPLAERVRPRHGAWQSSREAIYQAHWERDGVVDARRHVQDEILSYVSWSSAVRMPVLCLMEVARP